MQGLTLAFILSLLFATKGNKLQGLWAAGLSLQAIDGSELTPRSLSIN